MDQVDQPVAKHRRFRFGLRTLLAVVTVAAVASWAYWFGWPWWSVQREQERFLAAVMQTKIGMTSTQMPPIKVDPNCTKFKFELTPADRPAVLVDSYAW